MSNIPSELQAQMDAVLSNHPDNAPVQPVSNVPAPQQVAETVQSAPAPAVPVNTAPVVDPAPQVDYEHKYSVANGMLKKTASELKESQEENRKLKEQMEQLSQPAPVPATVDPSSITDAQIEEMFSQHTIEAYDYDILRDLAALPQRNAGQDNDARVKALEHQMLQQNTAAFERELNQLIPNRREVEQDPTWDVFLTSIQPMFGVTHSTLLDDARKHFDAPRAAEIFRAYLAMPQQAQGFEALTQPAPLAPNAQQAPAAIPYEQWLAEMRGITASGAPAMEQVKRQRELMAMLKEGRVSGITTQA